MNAAGRRAATARERLADRLAHIAAQLGELAGDPCRTLLDDEPAAREIEKLSDTVALLSSRVRDDLVGR